ncbi:MAG TPA: hypothetical protein VKS01_06280 [Bryobacteraceae bacterium]|nr:hypothetical protein [Bryobacteraceae bacterium]
MKKFSFPLSRVMDWREIQARAEESKLEALHAECRAIDAKIAELVAERERADRDAHTHLVSGAELAAADVFRRFSAAQHTRFIGKRNDCSKRIQAQIQVVAVKRRDVKLLERLKHQRLLAWTTAFHREIDAQAAESHLARWNAR